MRKCIFLAVLAVMWYVGHTRTIPVPTEPPSAPASNKNSTGNVTLEETAPKATNFDAPAIKSVVIHIPRTRREWEPTIPMDFRAIHASCEFDLHPEVIYKYNWDWYKVYDWNRGETRNCVWFYSMRYSTEGFYRIWSLLRLEAFFFGSYSERLYRYEYDLHYFDYMDINIPAQKT